MSNWRMTKRGRGPPTHTRQQSDEQRWATKERSCMAPLGQAVLRHCLPWRSCASVQTLPVEHGTTQKQRDARIDCSSITHVAAVSLDELDPQQQPTSKKQSCNTSASARLHTTNIRGRRIFGCSESSGVFLTGGNEERQP